MINGMINTYYNHIRNVIIPYHPSNAQQPYPFPTFSTSQFYCFLVKKWIDFWILKGIFKLEF
jgi:hypothetical protein